MADLYLVALDTTGIQSYIFGSNRLRENVGASHLVQMATSGWLLASPDRFLPRSRHNIRHGARQDHLTIQDQTVDVELLYAGGGNTVLFFRHHRDVTNFGRELSAALLCHAPGLAVVMAAEKFDWQTSLVVAMEKVMQQLAEKKRRRVGNHALLGLSVTAACQSTGLPANINDFVPWGDQEEQDRRTISAEVYAKQQQNRDAKVRLHNELVTTQELTADERDLLTQFDFPDDFDDLGRTKGEESYIGVVHADGNSIGKRLGEIADACKALCGDDNRHYINQLRQFSDEANQAGLAALREVILAIARWYNQAGEEQPGRVANANGKSYLPIRPIVFGGDDVTFVCDGRIALQCAQLFLTAFGRQTILGKKGIAGAGVAIVKVHYPFALAYHLAEALTKSAKAAYKRHEPALDWHLAQSGLWGGLDEIRRQEYGNARRHSLLMRPLTLASSTSHWQSWQNFTALLTTFQQDRELPTTQSSTSAAGETWSRSKLMELRSALREALEAENTTAVQLFSQRYRALPPVAGTQPQSQMTGWQDHQCVYYDAIEMLGQQLFPITVTTGGTEESERREKGAKL